MTTSPEKPGMSGPAPGIGPRGRRREREAIGQLLNNVRAGSSRVLVLRGAAGIGKTALLDFAATQAVGCHVVRATGVESEMELAFAGVHQLCAPLLPSALDDLPQPQRDALSTAFGLMDGAIPDRFLVGLAVLSLLAGAASEAPLICLIDDSQWLDEVSLQTLTFVARRLLAEPVALVFAEREQDGEDPLAGLPQLPVQGLSPEDSRALLQSELHGPLDEAVLERIISEAHGNPLALLELPRGLTMSELAGGFGMGETMPLTNRLEMGFLNRLLPLPPDTKRLLLLAAEEPVGDVALLRRAASRLGVAMTAAAPAEVAGLIEIRTHVRFRHPLVRSAARRSANANDLHEIHSALAEETDASRDPDRRAWHLAQAATGPDEDIAGELVRSADRARLRGGLAAYAAFLQRAAELTPNPTERVARALAAAGAKYQAGAPDAALMLLSEVEENPLDAPQLAYTRLLRAQVMFGATRSPDALPMLISAAKEIEPHDIGLARDTYLDVMSAALVLGKSSTGIEAAARAAQDAPPGLEPARTTDALLDGLSKLITEGHAAGNPSLRRALDAILRDANTASSRFNWLAGSAAVVLWDCSAWNLLSRRYLDSVRKDGAFGNMPWALNWLIIVQLLAGELTAASALVEEDQAIREATDSAFPAYGALGLAAWQGRHAEAPQMADALIAKAIARGEGMGLTIAYWASAVLANGLGRYPEALAAAESACLYPVELSFGTWNLVELVEAATRCGSLTRAHEAFEEIEETTSAAGTDWAHGVEARSRALLSSGPLAEGLFRDGLECLGRTLMRTELARTHLVYGEWLRRENRRVDARDQLRAAHLQFSEMGAAAFAERARRELLATGETVRKRVSDAPSGLTPQEAQIARLARTGRTNHEIGAELFISSRTVEWHLRKIYPKLGIRSRRDLRDASLGR